jgi:predicted HicB family RNase H-like nuclease
VQPRRYSHTGLADNGQTYVRTGPASDIVDDAYAEAAAEEAIAAVRRRGRPSLSRSGESPLLRVRLSRELDEAVTRAAEQAGTSRTEWVRQAITQAICKAS